MTLQLCLSGWQTHQNCYISINKTRISHLTGTIINNSSTCGNFKDHIISYYYNLSLDVQEQATPGGLSCN